MDFWTAHLTRLAEGYARLGLIDVAKVYAWSRVKQLARENPAYAELPAMVKVHVQWGPRNADEHQATEVQALPPAD